MRAPTVIEHEQILSNGDEVARALPPEEGDGCLPEQRDLHFLAIDCVDVALAGDELAGEDNPALVGRHVPFGSTPPRPVT